MRRFAAALAIAAGPFPAAGAAHAQASASEAATPAPQSGVTVRAPERMICQTVRRTATRMRASRVCRPVSQLNGEAGRTDEERLAEAADTLDALGADDISTNDQRDPMDRTPDTPLGPR